MVDRETEQAFERELRWMERMLCPTPREPRGEKREARRALLAAPHSKVKLVHA